MSAIASINVAPVRAFNGLKGEQSAKAAFKVTNGFKTSAMMVWTPVDNKFFETMSYLPPLTNEEISRQVTYITSNGCQAFPNAYVRIAGFDNVKQVQCASFLVYRPIGGAAKAVNARSV
eukprot:gene23924-29029_t